MLSVHETVNTNTKTPSENENHGKTIKFEEKLNLLKIQHLRNQIQTQIKVLNKIHHNP